MSCKQADRLHGETGSAMPCVRLLQAGKGKSPETHHKSTFDRYIMPGYAQ